MRASRLLVSSCLLVAIATRVVGQPPQLPPPFQREEPPGDPPPVPGFEQPVPPPSQSSPPEVLARGPLHEAFAQPSDPAPRQPPLVPKAPPEPIREIPPEDKPDGDMVVWIPGYWMWEDEREDFIWISGVWRVAPPGRRWVPGYWTQQNRGYRWVPGFWADASREALPYTDAPPDSLEIGPNQPAPRENAQWVPGIWINRQERWLWRPGFWAVPQPGWLYTPARYSWSPGGYLFVDGFWDRELAGRGIPYAPVALSPELCATPGFAFTPTYILNLANCLDSFWVRPSWGYYAFGDFYGLNYTRLGFQPWFNYGPRSRDPLFSYYRQANLARNPGWVNALATTYNRRLEGSLPRPPRTLAAQRGLATPATGILIPAVNYRNASLAMTRNSPQDRLLAEQYASAARQVAAVRARHEARPNPGGRRGGSLPLSPLLTPGTTSRSTSNFGRSLGTSAVPSAVPNNSSLGTMARTLTAPTAQGNVSVPRAEIRPGQPPRVVTPAPRMQPGVVPTPTLRPLAPATSVPRQLAPLTPGLVGPNLRMPRQIPGPAPRGNLGPQPSMPSLPGLGGIGRTIRRR